MKTRCGIHICHPVIGLGQRDRGITTSHWPASQPTGLVSSGLVRDLVSSNKEESNWRGQCLLTSGLHTHTHSHSNALVHAQVQQPRRAHTYNTHSTHAPKINAWTFKVLIKCWVRWNVPIYWNTELNDDNKSTDGQPTNIPKQSSYYYYYAYCLLKTNTRDLLF